MRPCGLPGLRSAQATQLTCFAFDLLPLKSDPPPLKDAGCGPKAL